MGKLSVLSSQVFLDSFFVIESNVVHLGKTDLDK